MEIYEWKLGIVARTAHVRTDTASCFRTTNCLIPFTLYLPDPKFENICLQFNASLTVTGSSAIEARSSAIEASSLAIEARSSAVEARCHDFNFFKTFVFLTLPSVLTRQKSIAHSDRKNTMVNQQVPKNPTKNWNYSLLQPYIYVL